MIQVLVVCLHKCYFQRNETASNCVIFVFLYITCAIIFCIFLCHTFVHSIENGYSSGIKNDDNYEPWIEKAF